MSAAQEFVDYCLENLDSKVKCANGGVLYSSRDSLSSGRFYFLGVNPGGSNGAARIDVNLRELDSKTGNSFYDEVWKSNLQHRCKWLFGQLGTDLRTVCSSNLVFVQSKDESKIDIGAWANLCWPAHRKILEIVDPEIVICHGGSAYSHFTRLLNQEENWAVENRPTFKSGHGEWNCRVGRATKRGSRKLVVGLPHLSRYAVNHHPHVVAKIEKERNAFFG